MKKANDVLLSLVPQEALQGKIKELETQKAKCVTTLTEAWDNGQTVDTRALRREYIALGKQITELKAHVSQPEQTKMDLKE